MELPGREELEVAARIVHSAVPPTPQYSWPLLNLALGTEAWVKHENHTPVGAFKVRGGLVYMHELGRQMPRLRGVISATRGNHGQSVAFAARRHGLPVTIVVPHGNSTEKNAAMRALGVELVEHGSDFQESREHALQLAQQQDLHMVPSFHRDLVRGVASCWLELFSAQPKLDVVLVPVGLGSGICAAVAARDALGLKMRIVGVVSAQAPAYRLSFEQQRPVAAPVSTLLADGLGCRVPEQEALGIIFRHVDDIVTVSDEQVAAAMKLYYTATHNVAEGAGAAALAAALQMKDSLRGQRLGLPLSGGNVDHQLYARILQRPASC